LFWKSFPTTSDRGATSLPGVLNGLKSFTTFAFHGSLSLCILRSRKRE
jgi:hypothetical protein